MTRISDVHALGMQVIGRVAKWIVRVEVVQNIFWCVAVCARSLAQLQYYFRFSPGRPIPSHFLVYRYKKKRSMLVKCHFR